MSFWDRLLEELRTLAEAIVEWAILILIALAVLIVGRWILKWVRRLIQSLLASRPMQALWDRSGITRALEPTDQTPASIAATVIYAYLMVGLWLIVVRILNLDTIEQLLERLLAWIPLLILAAIIVIIAAAAASWTAELVRPFAQERGVGWLSGLIRISVIVFGVLFALDVLGIQFAENIVLILIAAAGVALAVAFGVGGIDTARQWWRRFGDPDTVTGSVRSGSDESQA